MELKPGMRVKVKPGVTMDFGNAAGVVRQAGGLWVYVDILAIPFRPEELEVIDPCSPSSTAPSPASADESTIKP